VLICQRCGVAPWLGIGFATCPAVKAVLALPGCSCSRLVLPSICDPCDFFSSAPAIHVTYCFYPPAIHVDCVSVRLTRQGKQVLLDGVGVASEEEEAVDVGDARACLADPSALLAAGSPIVDRLRE
jgi:hypothetical protein